MKRDGAGKEPQTSENLRLDENMAKPVHDLLEEDWGANGVWETKLAMKLKDSKAKLTMGWTPELKDAEFAGATAVKGEWTGKLWNRGLKVSWSGKEFKWHSDLGVWKMGEDSSELWFNPYLNCSSSRSFSNQMLAQKWGFGFVSHGAIENGNWRASVDNEVTRLASGEMSMVKNQFVNLKFHGCNFFMKSNTKCAPNKGYEHANALHWSYAKNAMKMQLGYTFKNAPWVLANLEAGSTNVGATYNVNDKIQVGAMADVTGDNLQSKSVAMTLGAKYQLCKDASVRLRANCSQNVGVHLKGKFNVLEMPIEMQKTVETNLTDPSNVQ